MNDFLKGLLTLGILLIIMPAVTTIIIALSVLVKTNFSIVIMLGPMFLGAIIILIVAIYQAFKGE